MQMLRLQLLRLTFIVLGATHLQTNAQIPANHNEEENAVRVSRIMQRALARCRTQVDGGIQKIEWVPPTNDDLQEIKAMGEGAVVPLSRYVDTDKDGFSDLMAVRLLLAIGGPTTEAPLRRALASDHWQVTRVTALYGLVGVSKNHARPFVEAALNDPSSYVRDKASELYHLYYDQAE